MTLIPNCSTAVQLAANTDDFARQNSYASTLTVDFCAHYPLVSDPIKGNFKFHQNKSYDNFIADFEILKLTLALQIQFNDGASFTSSVWSVSTHASRLLTKLPLFNSCKGKKCNQKICNEVIDWLRTDLSIWILFLIHLKNLKSSENAIIKIINCKLNRRLSSHGINSFR